MLLHCIMKKRWMLITIFLLICSISVSAVIFNDVHPVCPNFELTCQNSCTGLNEDQCPDSYMITNSSCYRCEWIRGECVQYEMCYCDEICNDGVDNDCDQLIDCKDPSCEESQYCLEFGDAPDSTNTWNNAQMTAYTSVLANFPTVWLAGSPPYGPCHYNFYARLGTEISGEQEADTGYDQDGINNIIPPSDTPDQDSISLRKDWAGLFLAGMVLSGMLLSYYRMPFFYATFIIVLLLFWGVPKWRFNWRIWGHNLLRLFVIGVIGVVLFIPWGVNLIGGNLANAVEAGVTVGTPATLVASRLKILRNVTDYVPIFSWMAAVIAIIYALLRKNWIAAALPVWFALLIGYMAGAGFKLPFANMLDGFAIMIAVYIPLALLIGWLLGEIISRFEKSKNQWILPILSLLIILISAWYGWQQRLLLDLPKHTLVTSPDLRAMAWIEEQTPEEAFFLVQGFEYRQTAAGSDAGWWMPLLAERGNMLPPQYAQFNEIPRPPDFTQRVVDLITLLQENAITDPISITRLCEWGITHIYNGQQQGKAGRSSLYSTAELKTKPDLFTQIYHQDRVSIFTLNPAACHR